MTLALEQQRYERAKELFLATYARSEKRRAVLLARECSDDNDLRQRVERYLRLHDDSCNWPETALPPVPRTPPVALPQHLGPYRLLDELGVGGMGVVYRAQDTRLGRQVAIKLLHQHKPADAAPMQRFEREARVLASLNHPNVATLFSFERDGEHRFLVMELVEGETLAERFERGQLALEEALRVFLQIAAGLQAAHEAGIVHRDLKPANVAFDRTGTVKILDFGLARPVVSTSLATESAEARQSASALTHAGQVLGTDAYMSPEQTRSESVDRRTDIWAFGCCLYEALAGRRPFEGQGRSETMTNILEHDPDWEPLHRAPKPVRDLVARCLRKDLAKRLADLADAQTVLRYARGAGSRRRRLAQVFAAALLIVVIGGAWWRYGPSEGSSAESVPRPLTPTLAGLKESELVQHSPDRDARRAFVRGHEAANTLTYDGDNHLLAARMFTRAVELDPRFALAWARMSSQHSMVYQTGLDRRALRLEQAKKAALEAGRLRPDLPETHLALGQVHLLERNFASAERELDRAARTLPNDEQLLSLRAQTAQFQGDFAAAVELYRRAAEVGPSSSRSACNLAYAHTYMRRYAEAEALFEEALSLTPDNTGCHHRRAFNQVLLEGLEGRRAGSSARGRERARPRRLGVLDGSQSRPLRERPAVGGPATTRGHRARGLHLSQGDLARLGVRAQRPDRARQQQLAGRQAHSRGSPRAGAGRRSPPQQSGPSVHRPRTERRGDPSRRARRRAHAGPEERPVRHPSPLPPRQHPRPPRRCRFHPRPARAHLRDAGDHHDSAARVRAGLPFPARPSPLRGAEAKVPAGAAGVSDAATSQRPSSAVSFR